MKNSKSKRGRNPERFDKEEDKSKGRKYMKSINDTSNQGCNSSLECWACGKAGHRKDDCRNAHAVELFELKKSNNSKNNYNNNHKKSAASGNSKPSEEKRNKWKQNIKI